MPTIAPHRDIKFALLSDNQPLKSLGSWEAFEKTVRALRNRLAAPRLDPFSLHRGVLCLPPTDKRSKASVNLRVL